MAQGQPIRVLIADDHVVVREGLVALIDSLADIEVVGDASNGVEVIELAQTLQPDVILMDLVMPLKDGVSAAKEILQTHPHIRILVLTSFSDDARVLQAIEAGARGYLLKDSSSKELIQAIRSVVAGNLVLRPSIALKLARGTQHNDSLSSTEVLTERERDVLALLVEGLANAEIAARLGLSERTVTTHVSHILRKLQVENRTQAALYAIRHQLINPPEGDS